MYIDKKCPYFIYQTDRNGDIAIWCCALMKGEQDHEGNCGKYPCPLGKHFVKTMQQVKDEFQKQLDWDYMAHEDIR